MKRNRPRIHLSHMSRMLPAAVLLLGPALFAQIPPPTVDTVEKHLPPTFHCGDRDDLPMSKMDKGCYWLTQSFNAQVIFGAAFNAALDQFLKDKKNSTNTEWGQGAAGFSRRFGTRVSQSMAKATGQSLVGMALHEDPRFYPSRKEKFWPRLGFALSHTVIVRRDCDPSVESQCHEQFSAGRIAGAFSSGFVGMAWTPDSMNTPQRAIMRSGTALSGVIAGSLFKEFQPDLMKLVSRIFSRPPQAPKAASNTTAGSNSSAKVTP